MPDLSPPRRRRGLVFRFVAASLVLCAVAGYLLVRYVTGGSGPGCEVVSAKGGSTGYEFTPEQAVNAATITAVGTGRGMPERAVTIALATALQESGLRNLDHGDRDSLGLFQQRPSQGWGTAAEIMDPTYSADAFYKHLAKVPDYTELPLTVAAQKVQRSAYPTAYAKHEPDATLLSAALTGTSAATLTCEGRQASTTGATGPDAVRSALARDFGQDVLDSASAEVDDTATPTPTPSAGVTDDEAGRTVTLPVTAGTGTESGRGRPERGWQLAHWAVANASALHIESVTYAGRQWVAGNTDSRWRTADAEGAAGASGASGAQKDADGVRIVTAQSS